MDDDKKTFQKTSILDAGLKQQQIRQHSSLEIKIDNFYNVKQISDEMR